jgi:hypothetical protein
MKIACWTTFEFPTRITSGNKFEIISGVASCKHYFETFRHINGSTTNLNEHQCPKIAAKNQQLDEPKRGEARRGRISTRRSEARPTF